MDIGEWLRGLGLGQYEEKFRADKIDTDVLADLDESDLEKLGLPLGDRKRLIKAIAGLAPAAAEAPASSPKPLARADLAERRPIAVMFCDLAGSTGLAAKLDAEDWRNLVNAYLDAAAEAVTGFGGHVLKRLGDGLMALFGYPQAQENDAERAVRAALAIQRALADLNAGNEPKGAPKLAARIGIESGLVVVDATGEVFGDAPNVSARVQAAAEPGSVLVTMNVQRQVAGLFVAEDEGERELKGVSAPAQLFRIVRASGGGRRGGARSPTPFVGREEELGQLMRRWERTLAGDGQLALIVGEPGLGKSRLIEEFHARLKETPHTWVEWSASQLLQNTPLHPLAEWGRARFGADAPADERLADLEGTLRLIGLDPAEHAPLLAPLVDIPLPPDRAADLPPEELRRRQLAAMTAWVLAGSRSQPVVLAFEDLHWADPTSLDLLRALAERGAQARLFVLATTRPEFRPPWSLRSHHGVISLSPLDRAGVARMVEEIAARHALSKEVIDGVNARTGGVPLFVEEVTRLLLERGDESGAQAIPPTLQQSLAARLDRLGSAREVAQIGAVLGREFSYALLREVAAGHDLGSPPPPRSRAVPLPRDAGEDAPGGAVSFLPRGAGEGDHAIGRPGRTPVLPDGLWHGGGGFPSSARGLSEAALQAGLDRLAEADLMFVEGAPPQASYRFKHALVQDAAYDSMLKSRRQALHRRAAEILRADPERAAAEPEIVAHHFTEAGLDDLAIEWWGKAGDQALRRSAFREAIAHLGKAIAMADKTTTAAALTTVPETDASLRVKLQKDYAQAVQWSKGWGAAETKAAFERTDALATRAEMSAARFPALCSQAFWNLARGEMRAARDIAEFFLREAEAEGRIAEIGVARYALGLVSMFSGELADARSHLQKALDTHDKERDRKVIEEFGFGNGSNTSGALAVASWLQGDLQRAHQLIEEAVWLGNEGGHLPTALNALTYKTIIESLSNDLAGLVGDAEKVLTTSRQRGMEFYAAAAGVRLSWARGRLGEAGHGADELRNSLDAYSRQGNRLSTPAFLGFLAELEAAARDYERALAAIEEALRLATQTGERWTDALLHRIRGDILLKRDAANPAPAEDAYRTAIAIAQQQGTRSFELRAALALAKLYQSTSRPADAHGVLSDALEGFSPTPEMPEIAEARALLAALAETDEVKAHEAQRRQRRRLHVTYGHALFAARGYGAQETTAAFAKAHDLARGDEDPSDRLAADYGLWVGSYVRGELPPMRAHAEAFLRDVEAIPNSPEAGIAHRVMGVTHHFAGEYVQARDRLQRALELFQPDRDDDLAFRFELDPGVTVLLCSANALWPLGELDRASSFVERAQARMATITHVGALVFGWHHSALFELMRGDRPRAARNAAEVARLAHDHDLTMFRAFGLFLEGWAKGENETPGAGAGLEQMRRGADLLREQNVLLFDGLIKIALADAEARAGDIDRGLVILDETIASADRRGYRAFEAELHRARGELLVKLGGATSPPAEAAFQTAIAVAKQQGTKSFELRASLPLAKLYQSTGRPVEAHAVLGDALEGFPSLLPPGEGGGRPPDLIRGRPDEGSGPLTPGPSPVPRQAREEGERGDAEMPEIAEAQALLAALVETDEVKAARGQERRRTQLHVAYGNALIAARGYGAPETTDAFAKARDVAKGDANVSERLAADYGLWAGSYVRGELAPMRAHAGAFLANVSARPDSPEASVAHRAAGVTHWFAGEYREAQAQLQTALALFEPGRDDELSFRFGQDIGVSAMLYLAIALWPLGDVSGAMDLVARANERTAGIAHAGTRAYSNMHAAMFELMRRDLSRAAPLVSELVRLARDHDLPLWRALGVYFDGWVKSQSGAAADGLEDMRHAADLVRQQNAPIFNGLLKSAQAECEARAGNTERALTILDEALATSERIGHRAFDAELHRVRGEMLLKRDPASRAAAEEALQTAIAVAKQQGTRSFELRAALSLAKLYRSAGRAGEAHAVLAPALEGFPSLLPCGEGGGDEGPDASVATAAALTPDPSPTRERGDAADPEMPEIAEARALLAILVETEEVKAAIASRQRQLQLQTGYGKALMLSEGFASEDAKTAFARARELAAGVDNAAERFDTYYGLFVGSLMRGELRSARETAETFLRETEQEERTTEAAAARRCLGTACLFQGDLGMARTHFEQALRIFEPERDRAAKFRFGTDIGAAATLYLALANWLLGESGLAGKLIEEAVAVAVETAHAPTLAIAYGLKAVFDAVRDDAEAGRRAADSLLEVGRGHGLRQYVAQGALFSAWASARLGDRVTGMTELRQALAAYAAQGNKLLAPFFQGRLAEFEAEAQGVAGALARTDEALALADETDQRWTGAFLHRIRGDILLKADPENPGRAEEAFQTALAIAHEQGARSWGLRAALALAKLYQSTGRPAEARAVLAPALEGFPSLVPLGEGGGRPPDLIRGRPDEGVDALTPGPSPVPRQARDEGARGDAPTPEMPEIAEARALLKAL